MTTKTAFNLPSGIDCKLNLGIKENRGVGRKLCYSYNYIINFEIPNKNIL